MNKLHSFRNFLRSRKSEKGAVLVMFASMFVVLLIFIGVAIDLGRWTWYNGDAQRKVSKACITAANANRVGENPDIAFADLLSMNGYPADRYSPQQGSGLDLTRGLDYFNGTFIAAVSWVEPTVGFLQYFKITSFPVQAGSRCIAKKGGGLVPIFVRESAVLDSINGILPLEYTILGRDPKWDLADKESGENFRGAVFMHMWCIPPDDKNCPDVRVFSPLTSPPPSPATQKKLVQDCFMGINCSIYPRVGQRLPIVGGTSNAQICKSFQAGGWQVGDKMVVGVFPGEVHSPDATFGNWENVEVTGFTVYEITSFEPNSKNCNHVKAKLVTPQIYSSMDDIPNNVVLLRSREIQWDFQGGLPW